MFSHGLGMSRVYFDYIILCQHYSIIRAMEWETMSTNCDRHVDDFLTQQALFSGSSKAKPVSPFGVALLKE